MLKVTRSSQEERNISILSASGTRSVMVQKLTWNGREGELYQAAFYKDW